MDIYLSNQLEPLAEELYTNLYKEEGSPFAMRFVIVPSRGVKFWLERFLAKKSIFFGVEILPLDSALKILLKTPPPTTVELTLALTEQLTKEQLEEDPLLAEKLAFTFRRYSLYGYDCFTKWEKEQDNWQKKLWHTLFGKKGPFCPLAYALKEETTKREGIHLFGLSHLPTPLFHFFNEIGATFYQLSFCREFWSDILSDRELLAIGEDAFTDEAPPLLANFAPVMRKGLSHFDELEQITRYIVPKGDSQLQRMQANTLTFAKSDALTPDDSIELHIAPSKRREVEILYKQLYKLFSEKSYRPEEILILAPDLTPYTPYLAAYLPWPYTLLDGEQETLSEALTLFLELENRRMSSSALLELFSHSSFREKQRFTDEDLATITEWIEKANIRWGYDLAHKNSLLRHKSAPLTEETNSFMAGFTRLLDAIAQEGELTIKVSKLELLYRFYELVQNLYRDLATFYSEKRRPFFDYLAHLERVCATYFACEIPFAQLRSQAKSYANSEISPIQMRSLIDAAFGRRTASKNSNLCGAILCASLATGSQLPHKVVYILGLSEDTFPRKESGSSLDLLQGETFTEYLPQKGDFDRGFFLEALFSCQERLYLSYVERPSFVLEEFIEDVGGVTTYTHPQYSLEYACPKRVSLQRREVTPPTTIAIEELIRFVKSPLKHNYKYRARLYFSEERTLKEEEEFTLSPRERALLLRKKRDLGTMERQGAFPMGNFREIALMQTQKKEKEQEEILAYHGIALQECTTLSFDAKPLLLTPHTIVGSIENVTPKGLLVFEKGDFAGALRAYPAFLAANMRQECATLFFGKSKHSLPRFFDDPAPLLRKLLDLYLWACNQQAMLYPELIEPILLQDKRTLAKSIDRLFANSYDEALFFTYRDKEPPTGEELLASHYERIVDTYKELYDAWV